MTAAFWVFWIIHTLCQKRVCMWPISGASLICQWHVPEVCGYLELLEAVLQLPGKWASTLQRAPAFIATQKLPTYHDPLLPSKLLGSCSGMAIAPKLIKQLHPVNTWCCCLFGWHTESFRGEAGVTGQGWLWNISVLLIMKMGWFLCFCLWWGAWCWIGPTAPTRMCWVSWRCKEEKIYQ